MDRAAFFTAMLHQTDSQKACLIQVGVFITSIGDDLHLPMLLCLSVHKLGKLPQDLHSEKGIVIRPLAMPADAHMPSVIRALPSSSRWQWLHLSIAERQEGWNLHPRKRRQVID